MTCIAQKIIDYINIEVPYNAFFGVKVFLYPLKKYLNGVIQCKLVANKTRKTGTRTIVPVHSYFLTASRPNFFNFLLQKNFPIIQNAQKFCKLNFLKKGDSWYLIYAMYIIVVNNWNGMFLFQSRLKQYTVHNII